MSNLVATQAEFQQLADERLDEAKLLLDLGKWSGAYYLAGYAVELALKACIIKRLMATDAFPSKDFSNNCYTHILGNLLTLAGLEGALYIGTESLKDNWSRTIDWREYKRYHLIPENEARDLIKAIEDPAHGVLPWVKTHL